MTRFSSTRLSQNGNGFQQTWISHINHMFWYVSTCVYIYILYILFIYIVICFYIYILYICMHVYIYIYVCVCNYILMITITKITIHLQRITNINIHIYTPKYIYIYILCDLHTGSSIFQANSNLSPPELQDPARPRAMVFHTKRQRKGCPQPRPPGRLSPQLVPNGYEVDSKVFPQNLWHCWQ